MKRMTRTKWILCFWVSVGLLWKCNALWAVPVQGQGAPPSPHPISRPPTREAWLHVRVGTPNGGGRQLQMDMPLQVAEKILPLLLVAKLHDGRIRQPGFVEKSDLRSPPGAAHLAERLDLRSALTAVSGVADNVFLVVPNTGGHVRVAKAGDVMLAKIDDQRGGAMQLDVRLPLAAVHALTSGAPDALAIATAVRVLNARGPEELVTGKSHSEPVHVWIDAFPSPR